MFQGMFFSGIPVTALKETHNGVTTVTVIILTHCDTQPSLSLATQQKPKQVNNHKFLLVPIVTKLPGFTYNSCVSVDV